MYAIILAGERVAGYLANPNIEELDTLGTHYVLEEELPEIVLSTPAGYAAIRNAEGEYALEAVPQEPESQITQLENENALLALEIADMQIRLDQTEAEQARLLLALVEAEVI
ncbi:hypothetical protein [Cohnella boryungensis]|uniref:Uncharacterized protein n=1 Tax=Cohnella boryungensis TaxID=768479 RepID=A0ABV8SDP9_9BACL